MVKIVIETYAFPVATDEEFSAHDFFRLKREKVKKQTEKEKEKPLFSSTIQLRVTVQTALSPFTIMRINRICFRAFPLPLFFNNKKINCF